MIDPSEAMSKDAGSDVFPGGSTTQDHSFDRASTPATTPTFPSSSNTPEWLRAEGQPISGFVLTRQLGKGGFGEVWEARGPGDTLVAIKFAQLSDAGKVEKRALDLIKNIRHPHLLFLFGIWEVDGWLIVGTEIADESLFQRHRRNSSHPGAGLSRTELQRYFRETADALDFLNKARHFLDRPEPVALHHGDIKPQNLLLLSQHIKVADFGLVRVLGQGEKGCGLTPIYAAPEVFDGQPTRWSDQYALAVTYCELRGGRHPFSGSSIAALAQAHRTAQPDLTMLAEPEREVVGRALAKKPRERWPNCRQFVRALFATPGVKQPPTLEAGSERDDWDVPDALRMNPFVVASPDAPRATATLGADPDNPFSDVPVVPPSPVWNATPSQTTSAPKPQRDSSPPARLTSSSIGCLFAVALALLVFFLTQYFTSRTLASSEPTSSFGFPKLLAITLSLAVLTLFVIVCRRLWLRTRTSPDQSPPPSGSLAGKRRNKRVPTVIVDLSFSERFGHTDALWSVALCWKTPTAFTAGMDGQLCVWDLTRNEVVHQLASGHAGIPSICLSQDERRLLSGSVDGVASVWDLQSREQTAHHTIQSGRITAVAWLGESMRALLADSQGGLVLWNTTNGVVERLREETGDEIFALSVSPDGKILAVGDVAGNVSIWRQTSQQGVPVLDKTVDVGSPVRAVTLSPDCLQIVAGTENGRLWFLDLASGDLKDIPAHDEWVRAVAFMPGEDGWFLTAGDDDCLRGWRRDSAGDWQQVLTHRLEDFSVVSLAWTVQGLLAGSETGVVLFCPQPTRGLNRSAAGVR